jgi:hypothetical protein
VRAKVDDTLLRFGCAAGLLIGLAYAIQTYDSTPGKCHAGRCVGELLAETLLPAVLKTAAGGLAGLLLATLCVFLIRLGRRAR